MSRRNTLPHPTHPITFFVRKHYDTTQVKHYLGVFLFEFHIISTENVDVFQLGVILSMSIVASQTAVAMLGVWAADFASIVSYHGVWSGGPQARTCVRLHCRA